jgi:hypothetical protein
MNIVALLLMYLLLHDFAKVEVADLSLGTSGDSAGLVKVGAGHDVALVGAIV